MTMFPIELLAVVVISLTQKPILGSSGVFVRLKYYR